jgi:flagellar basal-body rod modification protein FlgD
MWNTSEVGNSVQGYTFQDLINPTQTTQRKVTASGEIVSEGDTSLFATKESLDKDDFLNLLIAQLKNQDPLEPQDNSEFIAQLAQFSSLETNQSVSSSMETLSSSMQTFMSLQTVAAASSSNAASTSLLGKSVRVSDNTISHTVGNEDAIKVQLDKAGSSAYVSVKNASGEVVAYERITAEDDETEVDFTWDGKADDDSSAPSGTYTIEVLDDTKLKTVGTVYAEGTVTGIRYNSDGANLVINGTNHLLKNVLSVDTNA